MTKHGRRWKALRKAENEHCTNFDRGAVSHWAERGEYVVKADIAAELAAQTQRAEAAEAKVTDLTAKLELANYVLQDDLNNRLTPRVVDIAYTAWQIGRSGVNKDDGGPCDWFNDTRPKVMDCIASVSAALKAGVCDDDHRGIERQTHGPQ